MNHAHASIVYINYKSAAPIQTGLRQLSDLGAGECVVVDNSGEFSGELAGCKVLHPESNLGFGKAANLAAQTLDTEWMVLVNPDLSISADELAGFLAPIRIQPSPMLILPAFRPSAPCVGFSPDIRHIAKRIPADNPDWVFCQGFCLAAINLRAFRAIGGFDENIFMYGEDLDLTIRLVKQFGLDSVRAVAVEFTHAGGASYTGPFRKLRRLRDSFASTCYVLAKHARNAGILARLFHSLLFSYPKLVRVFPHTRLRLDGE